MTEVSFHFNVPDRTSYACRLLRKAVRQGVTVVVAAPLPLLREFDAALWSFDPIEFVPHLTLRAGEPVAARFGATPVWLTDDPRTAPCHDVLVNFHAAEPGVPIGFESYLRLIEIVADDDAGRVAARERWKHYAARGYPLVRHDARHEAAAA